MGDFYVQWIVQKKNDSLLLLASSLVNLKLLSKEWAPSDHPHFRIANQYILQKWSELFQIALFDIVQYNILMFGFILCNEYF